MKTGRDFEADRRLCEVIAGTFGTPPATGDDAVGGFVRDCLFHGWPAALDALAASRAEADRLRAMLAASYDRVASQADALSRAAEGRAVLLLDKLRRLGAMRHTGPIGFAYENTDGTCDSLRVRPSRLFHSSPPGGVPRWLFTGEVADHPPGIPRTFVVDRITLDPEDAT